MALPVDYNTVPVRGKFVYLDGTPAQGTVRFTGKIAATSAAYDTVILPATISASLTNGAFLVNLPATDDPDIQPNGWTYTVEEKFDAGGGRRYEIDVPIAASVDGIDISNIAPVVSSPGDPTAFLTLSTYVEDQNEFQETLLRGYGFTDNALETCPRSFDFSATLASGRVDLSYVEAYRTVSISRLTVISKGTAVGALVGARLGVYEVDPDGEMTLLARTATITSGHLTNVWTDYGYPLDISGGFPASVTLEKGKSYAFGHFITYTGTNPTARAYATNLPTPIAAKSPRTAGIVTGQTDLPLVINSSSPSGNAMYFLASN